MITVNTNVPSLIAQSNLNQSSNDLTMAINRLSSGYRINSAADDPAGLSVAAPLQSQVSGLYQASRNALESTNVTDIADSALATMQDNLTRIRQIAVQSANGIYTKRDRANLQLEVDQLSQEISRIVSNTNYNGYQFFASRNAQFTFQIGPNGDGKAVSSRKAAKVNNRPMTTRQGVNSTKFQVINGERPRRAAPTPASSVTNTITFKANTLIGRGKHAPAFIENTVNTVSKLSNSVLNVTGKIGKAATLGRVEVFNNLATREPRGKGLNTYDKNLAAMGSVSVKTQSASRQTIKDVDADINLITGTRAQFGSLANRFGYVQRTNDATAQASESSVSRIMDADYGMESANYASAQIRQQAGAAVLAQANAMPQIALTLLQ